jgi:hypothetical protein
MHLLPMPFAVFACFVVASTAPLMSDLWTKLHRLFVFRCGRLGEPSHEDWERTISSGAGPPAVRDGRVVTGRSRPGHAAGAARLRGGRDPPMP